MTKTLTFYPQFPHRSQQPTIQSFAVLSVDGVEHIVGRATTLGLLRQQKSLIFKTANLQPNELAPVEVQAPRRDWQELPALDGVVDNGPLFTVARRFELMRMSIEMCLDGTTAAAILVGQGGLGKTHEVMATIAASGSDLADPQIGEAIPGGYDYDDVVLVTGTSSPQGLYKILHNHRHQTIVFDDCDEVTKDALCFNLLKGVLDTKKVRRVSWVSGALDRDGWETTIEFTGQIIFISNRTMEQFPQALHSRCLMLNLTLSEKEIFERIYDIGSSPANEWGSTPEEARIVTDFLYSCRFSLKELSLRTYGKAYNFYKSKPNDWTDLVLFSL